MDDTDTGRGSVRLFTRRRRRRRRRRRGNHSLPSDSESERPITFMFYHFDYAGQNGHWTKINGRRTILPFLLDPDDPDFLSS